MSERHKPTDGVVFKSRMRVPNTVSSAPIMPFIGESGRTAGRVYKVGHPPLENSVLSAGNPFYPSKREDNCRVYNSGYPPLVNRVLSPDNPIYRRIQDYRQSHPRGVITLFISPGTPTRRVRFDESPIFIGESGKSGGLYQTGGDAA